MEDDVLRRGNSGQADRDTPDTFRTAISGHPFHTYRESILKFLSGNPKGVYSVIEINAEIKGKIGTTRKVISRLNEEGQVDRTQRGYYRHLTSPRLGLLDRVIESSSIGIEALRFIKRSVRKGGTAPQCDTATCHKNDTFEYPEETKVPEPLRTLRTPSGHLPDTITHSRKGYPLILPTGQEIQWGEDEAGTETIIFKAGGKGPFPLELVIFLITRLEIEGLGPGWERVSIEWNLNSKRFSIAEPVTFQVCEDELLKFYQHKGLARLEGINRQVVGFPDTLIALMEARDRADGHKAMKELSKMKGEINQLKKECSMNNNLVHSLSDRVNGMDVKKRGPRKEAPLT